MWKTGEAEGLEVNPTAGPFDALFAQLGEGKGAENILKKWSVCMGKSYNDDDTSTSGPVRTARGLRILEQEMGKEHGRRLFRG